MDCLPDTQTGIERARTSERPAFAAAPAAHRDELDSELVDRVVLQINCIAKHATLDFALNVGKAVVDGFYGGSTTAWRSRHAKDTSFRKLARHPDLLLSPAALYRSVAMYEMVHRLGIDPRGRVSSGHLRAVLPLPHADQARILRLVDTQGWSVSRLEREVEELRRPTVQRTGRKARSVLRKSIHLLESWLTGAQEMAQADGYALDLSPESARLATATLVRVEQLCNVLRERISLRALERDAESATE